MIFSSLSALNALGCTPFSPGALSLANFTVDFLILSHEIVGSSSFIPYICLILSSTDQSIGLQFLNTPSKCGPNTELFSASVVASSPLSRRIRMMVGEA